jgi:hypothetical protein
MAFRAKEINWARVAFFAAITFAIFLTGVVVAKKQLQPYPLLEEGYEAAGAVYLQAIAERHELVEEISYPGDGIVHSDPGAYDGLTLIQGLFPEGAELRLLDMAGNAVHRWPVRFSEIWPEPSHVPPAAIPATDFNYHTQGMWLLPDGAVVFNVGALGTVKMDKCGNVLWTVDRLTHHSVTPNEDGSFWIPAWAHPDSVPQDLILQGVDESIPDGDMVRYEDRLLRVSADGVVEQEISVLRSLFDGEFNGDLYDSWTIRSSDPTHVNDIEVVTPELAGKIDGVEAGDLLASIRQMHMLAILDKSDGRIKWHATGTWVRQHDPDITADGIIELFNNGGDHWNSDSFPGSSIVALDATTGDSEVLYPASGSGEFFSRIMGTHQALPNGNRLITESMAGRVFEVDTSGEIVWDYVKPYDETHATVIEGAIRYENHYLSVQDWICTPSGEQAEDVVADQGETS